jgi:hypothetical protein
MFKKVLIANRGAIACRIIRTLRQLKVGSVAVYSQADANSLHVAQADEAVCIGPGPAAESYLRFEAIFAAARQTSSSERRRSLSATTGSRLATRARRRSSSAVVSSDMSTTWGRRRLCSGQPTTPPTRAAAISQIAHFASV